MPRPRLPLRIALLLALSCAAALSAQSVRPVAINEPAPLTQWRSYSYPADGFKADFPVQPGVEKKTIPTDAGPFELRSYMALDGQGALFVSICDYGDHLPAKDPATLLEGAKNGALRNSASHLISQQKISLGGNPGLQLESESDNAHFSARLYLVGTSLYQIIVAYPTTQPYPQTARFLDSFALIPRVAAQ